MYCIMYILYFVQYVTVNDVVMWYSVPYVVVDVFEIGCAGFLYLIRLQLRYAYTSYT